MKSDDANRLLRIFAGARLAVAVLLLTFGPWLPGDLVPGINTGMLALALLAAVVSSGALLLVGAIAEPRRMSWLVILLDVVLVTAVVAATGGARSIFTFLYVLTVISACVLLSRTGALAVAGLASALYTGLVFGRTVFPMTAFFEPPAETTALEVLTMFLNAGAFLVVAIVAGSLAERYRETHRELETASRDLRDLEAFRDVIFESVSTGLIALDGDHVVTAFNRAAEDVTGLDAQRAVGLAGRLVFGDVVPLDAIAAAVAQNPHAPVRHEATLGRLDGTAIPVRMTFSALRAGDGRQLGLIAACEDLSVIREMEARMQQADRLATLGRMAANIAHEIRNPLASLSGAVEAMAGDLVADDARPRLAQIVLRESDRLNTIIKAFLDYARPAPLTLQPVNVSEILDDVLALLEHRPLAPGIKLAREFPPDVVWPVDAQQFRQAVWNLALNAIDAMPDGGQVTLGAACDARGVDVWVTDTGAGIPASDLGQIFEPFFSTKPGGSGLGLALVHRIVTEHGGRVDVRSAPGFGTTVTLRLPRRDG